VAVLLSTHPRFADHRTGTLHPERPARLEAVLAGARAARLGDDLLRVTPRMATRAELGLVHEQRLVDAIEAFCGAGGGHLDADTTASAGSFAAAALAVGAGLDAIERLDRGEGDAAFCAVRPPGHHATPQRAMGFCLLNSVAVAAATLAARGERVLVVDYDAHHGNGTQAAFESDPRVVYVSMHQFPLYPGTGAIDDVGEGPGRGATVNVPFPPGTTGDVYLAALDEVVAPVAEEQRPTWLLLSAGFDLHRDDPLTGLGLTAGDVGLLTSRLLALVPRRRCVAFLEGGYDLAAVANCTTACLVAMAGGRDGDYERLRESEPCSSGGPGRAVVTAVAAQRRHHA